MEIANHTNPWQPTLSGPLYAKRLAEKNSQPIRRVLHVCSQEDSSDFGVFYDMAERWFPRFGCQAGFVGLNMAASWRKSSPSIPRYVLRMRSPFDLRAARRLAQIVKYGGYDLVHGHTCKAVLVNWIAAKRCSVPVILQARNALGRRPLSRWWQPIRDRLDRCCLKEVTMICDNDEQLNQLSQFDYLKGLRYIVRRTSTPSGTVASQLAEVYRRVVEFTPAG